MYVKLFYRNIIQLRRFKVEWYLGKKHTSGNYIWSEKIYK